MHEQVEQALRVLCATMPLEIRALGPQGMEVRRFDDYPPAAKWAEQAGETAKAVYVVMNPFDPTKIRGSAADDQAVTARRWLLIDVDPSRPVDANSSREELEIATGTARVVEEYLSENGFPAPIRALSGNGAHLLYRMDLPNDPEAAALVGGVLKYLSTEFSIEGKVSVDTTVGNASRITKLYGTPVRKGPETATRPHRRSKLTRIPDVLAPVPIEALRAVAALAMVARPAPAVPPSTAGEYDLGQVLSRVYVVRTFAKDGTTWHVIRCPWAHEHSSEMEDEATVVTVGSGGALGFRCLHAHCADRRWEQFRDRLALETKGWQERKARQQAQRPEVRPTESPRPANRVTVADVGRRPEVLARMADYARTGAMPGSLATGMRRLDGMLLGGLRPGKFYVLGGESGRGKTTLLLQWAFHVARSIAPRVVGIVSPEMSAESLDERAYAQLSGFGLAEYKHWPDRGRENWSGLHAPQNVRASFDPKDIQAFAVEEKPSLFIVDYAQQAVDYEAERRHTALGRLGADCLDIAKQLSIPVVLGTQVNVTAERDFTVRETRILEHQADATVFIDVQYEKVADAHGHRQVKAGAALVVEKNRHGATGRIPVSWERERFRFVEEL